MKYVILSIATVLVSLVAYSPSREVKSARKLPPSRRDVEDSLQIRGNTYVVVAELPFKVVAPAGAKLYFWTLPNVWKHDAGNVSTKNEVTVNAAPEGSAVVTVVTVDEKFTTRELSLKVNVGKVTPPVPPVPPVPPPDDALVKSLQSAYASDKDTDKVTSKAKLASVWKQASTLATDTSVPTMGEWLKRVQELSKQNLSVNALTNTRRAVADYLNKVLPRSPDLPLTSDTRSRMARESLTVSAALESVK